MSQSLDENCKFCSRNSFVTTPTHLPVPALNLFSISCFGMMSYETSFEVGTRMALYIII